MRKESTGDAWVRQMRVKNSCGSNLGRASLESLIDQACVGITEVAVWIYHCFLALTIAEVYRRERVVLGYYAWLFALSALLPEIKSIWNIHRIFLETHKRLFFIIHMAHEKILPALGYSLFFARCVKNECWEI